MCGPVFQFTPVFSRNVLIGGSCDPTDKTVADYQFKDLVGFDFHLTPSAAAIDAGDPEDAPPTDIDGQARDSAPDAGADEFVLAAATPDPGPNLGPGPESQSPTSDPTKPPVENPGHAGQVGFWSFDEPRGSSARDLSGRGNHGRVHGARRTAGRFGAALQFDGRNDFVRIPDAPSLDLTKAFTFEAWVRPGATRSQTGAIMAKGVRRNLAYGLFGSTRKRGSGVMSAVSRSAGARATPLSHRRWSHLTLVYSDRRLSLFVNGRKIASRRGPSALTSNNRALTIGGTGIGGDWFKGKIDEARLYSRALSAKEIKADMRVIR
jgi:hypothetical protein